MDTSTTTIHARTGTDGTPVLVTDGALHMEQRITTSQAFELGAELLALAGARTHDATALARRELERTTDTDATLRAHGTDSKRVRLLGDTMVGSTDDWVRTSIVVWRRTSEHDQGDVMLSINEPRQGSTTIAVDFATVRDTVVVLEAVLSGRVSEGVIDYQPTGTKLSFERHVFRRVSTQLSVRGDLGPATTHEVVLDDQRAHELATALRAMLTL